MATFKQNSKLMAKNSAFMYIQMGVKMLIGLYTVRVFLHALGAEDYGIYNVVGGFVGMFSFLSNTLVSAAQRFFAYSIGRDEREKLNGYFNAALISFFIIAVVIFAVLEGIGYWFVNYKMVVPENRLEAANWVLHFAILAFVVRFIVVPYRSMIVAHEKLIIYACISVLDALLILGIAFLIQTINADKLKAYAVCMFGVSLISSLLFAGLSIHNYREATKIRIRWNGSMTKELLTYSGWFMFGTLSTVVRFQGVTMILNIFFGPLVNAARAIAGQILHAINQFTTSFYNAVRPQIIKLDAAKNFKGMLNLVYGSSVISFLLLSLITVPLLIETPYILHLWLGKVPEHTITFSRLIVITAMIDSLGLPLTTAYCAEKNIRNYQVITGTILILNLPVSYFLFKAYHIPELAYCASIVLSSVAQFVRVVFMNRRFGMPYMEYAKEVLFRIGITVILAFALSYGIAKLPIGHGLGHHLITFFASIAIVFVLSFYLGLKKSMREKIVAKVRSVVKRKMKK